MFYQSFLLKKIQIKLDKISINFYNKNEKFLQNNTNINISLFLPFFLSCALTISPSER